MRRTRIKICGLRSQEEVDAAVRAGADAVGFVFAPRSPRRIEPEAAAQLVMSLPPFVRAVAVFKDQPPADVSRIADQACIDMVQLHGTLSASQLSKIAEQLTVVRALRTPGELLAWSANPDVDLLMIDASEGTGARADTAPDSAPAQSSDISPAWAQLADLRADSDDLGIILAGGLTPSNVADAIRTVRPFAVDVSSGVEDSPGLKNPARIAAFCAAVRAADASLA